MTEVSQLEALPSVAAKPHKSIGVAVIWNQQRQILIDRRKPDGSMGGLWEFPGGKVEPNETIVDCVRREIREELGIEIEVGDRLMAIDYDYAQFSLTLHVYQCQHRSGEPTPIACDAICWVTANELDQYEFPAANQQIIAAIQAIA
jgi:mutator protein MutT